MVFPAEAEAPQSAEEIGSIEIGGQVRTGEAAPMKRDWALLTGAVGLALVLHLAYLFEIRILSSPPTPNLAWNASQPNPDASFPFGLPPYVTRSWLILWVVQPALGASIPLLLYVIGRRAFSRPVGLLSAFMGAIYAPFVVAEGLALPFSVAPFFACLALLSLLIAQQRGCGRDWLLAGVAVMLFLLPQLNTPKEAAWRAEASLKQRLSAFRGAELGPSGDSNSNTKIRRQVAVRRLPLLTFGVIGPFGLLGLLLSLKRWRAIGLLHVACFGSLGLLLVSVASGVAHLILIPPLLVCAAFTVCWAYERAAEDARRSLAVAGITLVLLTWLIHLPIPIARLKAGATIEEVKTEGSGKQEMRVKEAPVRAPSAVGREEYRVHLRRAGRYSSQGKLEEAVQEFERAAALAPAATALDIRIRLALSLEEGGRYAEAKRRWEEVAALEPPSGIAELARRHVIRMKRKLRTEPPVAAEQKGAEEWESDAE